MLLESEIDQEAEFYTDEYFINNDSGSSGLSGVSLHAINESYLDKEVNDCTTRATQRAHNLSGSQTVLNVLKTSSNYITPG